MAKSRRGLGKGRGKGYKNIIGKDPVVHSQSARGMKQPQRMKGVVGSLGRGDKRYINTIKKYEPLIIGQWGWQRSYDKKGDLVGYIDAGSTEIPINKLKKFVERFKKKKSRRDKLEKKKLGFFERMREESKLTQIENEEEEELFKSN